MALGRQLPWMALTLSAACYAPSRGAEPPSSATGLDDQAPSGPSFAVVLLTRTLVDDAHVAAGGQFPVH